MCSGILIRVVLRLRLASQSPRGLTRPHVRELHYRVLGSVGLGYGPRLSEMLMLLVKG